jgi:hypothetical protein
MNPFEFFLVNGSGVVQWVSPVITPVATVDNNDFEFCGFGKQNIFLCGDSDKRQQRKW